MGSLRFEAQGNGSPANRRLLERIPVLLMVSFTELLEPGAWSGRLRTAFYPVGGGWGRVFKLSWSKARLGKVNFPA